VSSICHTDSCACAGDGLLALKTGWTNWEVFAEENQVLGWNSTINVCEWTGVYCLNTSGIGRVFWLCGPTFLPMFLCTFMMLSQPHAKCGESSHAVSYTTPDCQQRSCCCSADP